MNELRLVTSEKFGEVPCAFYRQDGVDEVLLTREQIGTALEYSDPRTAITKIHSRHKERLDKYSMVVSMSSEGVPIWYPLRAAPMEAIRRPSSIPARA